MMIILWESDVKTREAGRRERIEQLKDLMGKQQTPPKFPLHLQLEIERAASG